MADKAAIKRLISSLDYCSIFDPRAKDKLVMTGKPAVHYLIKALSSDKWYVRYEAARILGRIGDKKAIRHLVRLLYDTDPNINHAAVRSLGDIGGLEVYVHLRKILTREKKVKIKDDAAHALSLTGDSFSARESVRYYTGKKGIQYGHFGKSSVPFLIDILQKGGRKARIRIAVELGLLKDKRASNALITCLSEKDPELRSEAASALGWIRSKKAVLPLIKAAQAAESDIQVTAIESLGRIKDARAIPVLIEALADKELRDYAAHALVELGEVAVTNLRKLLHDKDPNLKRIAIDILGRIGSPAADVPIVRTMKKSNKASSGLREYDVIYDQASTSSEEACEKLAELAGHKDRRVRRNAILGLISMNDPRGLDGLNEIMEDADNVLKSDLVDELYLLRSRVAAIAIAEVLKKWKPHDRLGAIIAFREIGKPALDPMIDLLRCRERHIPRMFILGSLYGMRDEKTLSVAIEALSDEDANVRLTGKRLLDHYVYGERPEAD